MNFEVIKNRGRETKLVFTNQNKQSSTDKVGMHVTEITTWSDGRHWNNSMTNELPSFFKSSDSQRGQRGKNHLLK